MSFLQWRKFNFFDVVRDGDVVDAADSPAVIGGSPKFQEARITVCVSGNGQIVVGDAVGNIYFINRQLEVSSFKAYALSVSHIVVHPAHVYMITVGEDEVGVNPLIKVWNLEKRDPRTGHPLCRRISRAMPNNRPLTATALAVDPDLNAMAVGFQDGSVLLSRGDVTRDRGNKQKVLREGNSPVTGLAFQSTSKASYLFVVTLDCVWSYCRVSRDKEIKVQLDEFGVPPNAIALADGRNEHHLILGRKDALYCYSPDSRGSCFAFDGEKLRLHWFKGYLVVVTRQELDGRPAELEDRSTVLPNGESQKHVVKVYDLQNRLIAHEGPVGPGGVAGVVSEWGSVIIILDTGRIIRLVERDVSAKLNVLFKRNLYDTAIKLARGCGYDAEGLADIFRMYGDHLYAKGEFRAAAVQYTKTVRRLEPAYVIRKFLDAQRIQELTLYLTALHDAGIANQDHTTLLLNCYTKLKDTGNLDRFVASEGPGLNFDVVTAIRVCRQAGYYKQALALARKHRVHDLYLKIQLDDHGDYKEALDYITRLPFAAVESTMKKYGGMLMEKHPDETAAVLRALCTDYRPMASSFSVGTGGGDADTHDACERADAEEFLHVFTHHPAHLKQFLLDVEKSMKEMTPALYSALLQVHLQEWTMAKEVGKESEATAARTAAVELLHNKWTLMDKDQALILCQNASFKPGVVFLYEKSELYGEILKLEASEGNFVGVVAACKRFGGRDPHLWVEALEIFAPAPALPENLLLEVLTQIERGKLLSPLLVLETLSASPTISLGMVSSYLCRALEAEMGKIDESERMIQQYSAETEQMKAEIHQIRTSATVFQDTKCHGCNHRLELPSIHFLCKHSFHQSCFESYSDNEAECPACAPENRKLRDVIGAHESSTLMSTSGTADSALRSAASEELAEKFFEQLSRADDGFSVVADYFGRGVFNKVTVVADRIAGGGTARKVAHAGSTSAFGADPSRPGGGSGSGSGSSMPTYSEGRLRAYEGRSAMPSSVTAPSEARLRGAEGWQAASVAAPSEARLRKEEKSVPEKVHDRRGEGRLRLHEGTNTTNVTMLRDIRANPENPNSLMANLDKPSHPVSQPQTRQRPSLNPDKPSFVRPSTAGVRVEARPNVSVETAARGPAKADEKAKNPFEEDDDYDDSLNPFADEDEEKPVKREGDADSYDDSLNPFA